jgi:Polysaccharide lyase
VKGTPANHLTPVLACLLAALALFFVSAPVAGADSDAGQAQRGRVASAHGKHHHRRHKTRSRTRRRRANGAIGISSNTAISRRTETAAQTSTDGTLDAGFENGLTNWNTAGVGDVVPAVAGDIVRSGAGAADVALSGSEGRSELILGGNGGGSTTGMVKFEEGAEYYYGFSFYIQSMVYGHPGAHNLIMQFKSEGEGSPNFGLQLWDYAGDDGHSGGRGLWSSGDAMGGDRFLAPVAEHQWHDVVLHFKASSQNSGFYEVHVDGNLVDSRSGVSMIVPDHSYAYIKNGIYRNGGTIPGTSELRLDAAKLGTSPDAVLPN